MTMLQINNSSQNTQNDSKKIIISTGSGLGQGHWEKNLTISGIVNKIGRAARPISGSMINDPLTPG
jgi:hypothetical protein